MAIADPKALAPQEAPVAAVTPYENFVNRITTQVIAAMPVTVPDEALKRARSRMRVAFSENAQGALSSCSPESVARAIVLSAMSGLYPGGPRPDVWLIPRKNKAGVLECNWQISFRGYIRLGRRSGWELEPVIVYEGEKFEIGEGDRPSITHVRNLEAVEKLITPADIWAAIRYAYIRVYPEGRRDGAKIGYLSKAQITQRRGKAQDQGIWTAWPAEQVYKTMCHYAGNRELFPTDDPSRYALDASEQAELGSGSSGATEWVGTGQTKTERLAQRLAAPPAPATIDVSPQQQAEYEPTAESHGEDPEPSLFGTTTAPASLSQAQLAEIMALAEKAGVDIGDLEEWAGGPLSALQDVSAAKIEADVVAEIRKRAKVGKK